MKTGSLKKITIENKASIDKYVRDVFGVEHIIFPGDKKKIVVLKKGKQKNG